MSIKDKLASLGRKAKENTTKTNKKDATSQRFVVMAYRDQELYMYLAQDSGSSFSILNFIKLKIPSLVVGQDEVLRIKELAETISDVVEVFVHENNIESPISDLPAIVLLESSKFDIGHVSLTESMTYSEAIDQINDQLRF